ncbi:MAG: hypothetical protein U0Z26_11165 [Anaerolineales bacterium]
MTSRNTNSKYLFALAMVFVLFFVTVLPVQAKGNIPGLDSFIMSVQNGDANALRGVYVKNVMAYPVVQQPSGYAGYVSTDEKVVTQFGMAAAVGNIGLLAHDNLAGSAFPSLVEGDVVVMIYGDGHTEKFQVTRIYKYQALNPFSPTSSFKDLDSNVTISAEELFRLVYRGDRHVTFQTCIEANGNLSWGRLFVVAEPIEDGASS